MDFQNYFFAESQIEAFVTCQFLDFLDILFFP